MAQIIGEADFREGEQGRLLVGNMFRLEKVARCKLQQMAREGRAQERIGRYERRNQSKEYVYVRSQSEIKI